MDTNVSIIITISLILISSPFLSRILRIPTTPIEIALGSIAILLGFVSHNEIFHLMAEVGFFYLMFLAGLEVDLRDLLRTPKNDVIKGLLYTFSLFALSYVAILIFDLSILYIAILPLISIGLLPALIKEFGKDVSWLNFSLSMGIIGEIFSIAALTITSASFEFGVGFELYRAIGYFTIFLLAVMFVFHFSKILFWWFPILQEKLMPQFDKNDKDVRFSMAIFFLIIAVMLILHLEVAFGAFVAGMFITTFFDHKASLPHKLESFGFGFLVPIFFIYVGTTFDLRYLLYPELLMKASLIIFLMIFIRFVSSFIFDNLPTINKKFLFALSHSMPLTLIVAISTIAYKAEHIQKLDYYALILASIAEVIICMILIKGLYKIKI
ncbi:MAG: NA+/H+ antiporter (napA), putative [uncultured Campylobacterales bacterium]|uniref:NA+/H+ antiporter (NapA), putative n=1 Tax=uncultured Campylobacterales bacterium TaxID=352960 RepID=A0A6S6SBD9_9BACT|nr:MAG: NA+/H+ antiporter (napA), putative [uncultured Campylobacterales bacterium]